MEHQLAPFLSEIPPAVPIINGDPMYPVREVFLLFICTITGLNVMKSDVGFHLDYLSLLWSLTWEGFYCCFVFFFSALVIFLVGLLKIT